MAPLCPVWVTALGPPARKFQLSEASSRALAILILQKCEINKCMFNFFQTADNSTFSKSYGKKNGPYFYNAFCFRAAPVVYGSSRNGGQIGAVAADLHPSSWQRQIPNPLSEARERTRILMDTSQVLTR